MKFGAILSFLTPLKISADGKNISPSSGAGPGFLFRGGGMSRRRRSRGRGAEGGRVWGGDTPLSNGGGVWGGGCAPSPEKNLRFLCGNNAF